MSRSECSGPYVSWRTFTPATPPLAELPPWRAPDPQWAPPRSASEVPSAAPRARRCRPRASVNAKLARTHLVLVLDASAAMADMADAARAAFNQQVRLAHELATATHRLSVSVVQFAQTARVVLRHAPVQALRALDAADYAPAGAAALFDALGVALDLVFEHPGRDAPGASALVVLITDGVDDASRFETLCGLRRVLRWAHVGAQTSFLLVAPAGAVPRTVQVLPPLKPNGFATAALTACELADVLEAVAQRRACAAPPGSTPPDVLSERTAPLR